MNAKKRAKRAAKRKQIMIPRGQISFGGDLISNVHVRDRDGKPVTFDWIGQSGTPRRATFDLGAPAIVPGTEQYSTTTERDPHGKDPHQPGAKLDADKPRAWLMLQGFGQALTAVADVTTKGAAKYTPDGWRHVANGSNRYMEAFARHALALARGEQIDPDTGCLHKAQMAWNLLASLELDMASKATP